MLLNLLVWYRGLLKLSCLKLNIKKKKESHIFLVNGIVQWKNEQSGFSFLVVVSGMCFCFGCALLFDLNEKVMDVRTGNWGEN